LQSRAVLIAGGDGKGADFSPLAPVAERAARAVILIGRDAPLIEAVLRGRVVLVHAQDMDDAVHRAAELGQPGDCVLLSPACASFDMFDNYEHRGRVFAEAVRRLEIKGQGPRAKDGLSQSLGPSSAGEQG
jgi:UDP-N-acetylmuramoylalanine--D-glutamate ligase